MNAAELSILAMQAIFRKIYIMEQPKFISTIGQPAFAEGGDCYFYKKVGVSEYNI